MLGVVLAELVEHGTLTFIWPDGTRRIFGAGGPRATVRLHGRGTPWTVGLRPELAFGEAYMDGRLTVEEGTMADVLEILISNMGMRELPANMRMLRVLRHLYRPIA